MNKITWAGFLIGIIGWLVGALGGKPTLGMTVFIAGFYFAAIGMVYSVVCDKYEAAFKLFGIGIKLAALGFAIASLRFIFEMRFPGSALGGWVFYLGGTMSVVGILLAILRIKSNKGSGSE